MVEAQEQKQEQAPIGCSGIEKALSEGLLRRIDYYTGPVGDDATDYMVTFTDPLLEFESDELPPIMQFNYCPFCGTRMENGKPQCAGNEGRPVQEIRDVLDHD